MSTTGSPEMREQTNEFTNLEIIIIIIQLAWVHLRSSDHRVDDPPLLPNASSGGLHLLSPSVIIDSVQVSFPILFKFYDYLDGDSCVGDPVSLRNIQNCSQHSFLCNSDFIGFVSVNLSAPYNIILCHIF